MKPIRIAIADPNYLVRQGLKAVFLGEDSYNLAGEYAEYDRCLDELTALKPDLLVLGITVHSVDGPAVVKRILKKRPEQKLIVIDTKENINDIVTILRMGVQGYILKQCDKEEILEATRQVLKGKRFFCSNVVKLNRSGQATEEIVLSERELQVLSLIAEGLTNKEIGDRLFLSAHTVATHRKNLMRKFRALNNVDLVIRAIKHRILVP
ncbi:MAG: response regulator transcription factor [Flavobacteriales bacterium]|nr:response regulator transcription factor [Flavobacteriales bacterium]MCX7769346.1 response regulator transcription factor [Flavobacteriales bacterium]MDW8411017.1 response regulator transcription factor [Flavobacteriales bacterium]